MFTGPNIVEEGLVLVLDAANTKSYPGSGTTWTDLSGNGYNGTLTNATFNSSNRGTISFDGTNDYVLLTDGSRWFTNQWAYEFAVKFNGNSGTYQGILWGEGVTGGGSGYQKLFTLYNYSYFHYRIYNSTTSWTNTNYTPSGFTPTSYNHLVWQFNNGTTNIFINGSLVHTDTSRGAYSGGTDSPLYIGCRNDLAYDLNGQIGFMKRYNRILTASEVLQNYNATKSRFGL